MNNSDMPVKLNQKLEEIIDREGDSEIADGFRMAVELIETMLAGKVILPVDDIELLLSFAPELGHREGLDPTFYHTLNYSADCELQKKVNRIKAMLSTIEES